jgi:hypothetical protein
VTRDTLFLTWSTTMCQPIACAHTPACPAADAADHDAAAVVSRHPEQGWSLLCNGVVVFDDTGELLPDGRTVDPHRPACRVWTAA